MRLARTLPESPSPRRVEARAEPPSTLRGGVGDEAAAAFGETFREAVARIDREDGAPERSPRTGPDEAVMQGPAALLARVERPTATAGTASLDGWLACLSGSGEAVQHAGDLPPAEETGRAPSLLHGLIAEGERLDGANEERDEADTARMEEASAASVAASLPALSVVAFLPGMRRAPTSAETANDAVPAEESGSARRGAAALARDARATSAAEGSGAALDPMADDEARRPQAGAGAGAIAASAEGRDAHGTRGASVSSRGATARSGDAETEAAGDGERARERSRGVEPAATAGHRRDARDTGSSDAASSGTGSSGAEPGRERRSGVGPETSAGERRDAREAKTTEGRERRATHAASKGTARGRSGAAATSVAARDGARAPSVHDLVPSTLERDGGTSAVFETAAAEHRPQTETGDEGRGPASASPIGGGRLASDAAGEAEVAATTPQPVDAEGGIEPTVDARGAARAENRGRGRSERQAAAGEDRAPTRRMEVRAELPEGASSPSAPGATETSLAGPTEPSLAATIELAAPGPTEPVAPGSTTATLPEAAPAPMAAAESGSPTSPSDRWSAREGYLPPGAPDGRTSIELDHPTLGPLSLRFAADAGRVAVELGASSVAAAVALRTSEAELRRELAGSGTELARFRVRTKGRGAAEDASTPGTWQPPAGHARRRI